MNPTTAALPLPDWYEELIELASRSLEGLIQEEGGFARFAQERERWSGSDTERNLKSFWGCTGEAIPAINPGDVLWLRHMAVQDGNADLLAAYALNPTWAGFPPSLPSGRELYVLREAYRILIRAASVQAPADHSSLWRLKDSEMSWESQGHRQDVFEILSAGWSGVGEKNLRTNIPGGLSAFPGKNLWPLFERLLRDHPLGEYARFNGHGDNLTVRGAFVAWREGVWTPDAYRSMLDVPLFNSFNMAWLSDSTRLTADDSYGQFVRDFKATASACLDSLLMNDDLELGANNFWHVEPTLHPVDVILRIGHAIESGRDPVLLIRLMSALEAPEEDRAESVKRLKELDGKTLLYLLRTKSGCVPMILEALPDRKLAKVIETVFGAFCTSLLPENIADVATKITYPELFPGRTASGFTNLQPFFDMLAKMPISTVKKALPTLRKGNACSEDAVRYVTYHLDIPAGRSETDERLPGSRMDLSRRVPTLSPERETSLAERASSHALWYFNRSAGKTVESVPTFRFLRQAMCSLAEAAGFDSIEAALLECARRWISSPVLEVEGYTLTKRHDLPEGLVVTNGKKPIKNIPPVIKKKTEVMLFRAEAYALWQARLSFEDEALLHYIDTGELHGNPRFNEVFGCQSTDTLRLRLADPVPALLEKEILDAFSSTQTLPVAITSIPPVIASKVFPELIRRGWEHSLGKGDYQGIFSRYKIKDGVRNVSLTIDPVDPRENRKQGITPPATLQKLSLEWIGNHKGDSTSVSSSNERVIGLILRDLVTMIPPGKKGSW